MTSNIRSRPGLRFLSLLSLVVLALLTVACGDDDDAQTSAGDDAAPEDGASEAGASVDDDGDFDGMIKIGVNASVTGAAASNGEPFKDSALLGIHQVNESGGIEVDGKTYGFEAVVRDNETDPEKAIGIAQEFLRDDVKFVVGPGISTVFSPAFESIQGTETLVIAAAGVATSVVGTPEGELLFSPINPQAGENGLIKNAAEAAVERFSPATAAILLPDDPLGELHGSSFEEGLTAAGVEIVYNERFAADTVDFAPFVTQVKSADPDLLVIGPLDRWVEPILAEAGDADFTDVAIVGTPGVSQAPFDDAPAFERAMVTMVTRAVDNADDESLDEFRQIYTDFVGEEPGSSAFWSLIYYDAIQMLAEAMEVAGTTEDVQAVAEAMSTDAVTDYPGRALALEFDDVGQARYPVQHHFMESGDSTYVE